MIAASGAATPWTAVAAVVLAAFGVSVSIVSLVRTRRASQAQALQRLIEQIQATEARTKRKRLYELADKPWPWTENEIDDASDVLQAFVLAGILARERMVPWRVLAREWGIAVMRVRIAGAALITDRRTNENPLLWDRLDWLALRAQKVWEHESEHELATAKLVESLDGLKLLR